MYKYLYDFFDIYILFKLLKSRGTPTFPKLRESIRKNRFTSLFFQSMSEYNCLRGVLIHLATDCPPCFRPFPRVIAIG